MGSQLSLSEFRRRFSDDEVCLEEIRRIRFPYGIQCKKCWRITRHYKLRNRTAYACKYCRSQVYPLSDTVFDKSTTPLHIWFYALFIMTQLRAQISITALQEELEVTYKTAWRIHTRLKKLMEQNDGDLLYGTDEKINAIRRWSFFNAFEVTVVQKEKE
jgi:transposase